MKRYLTKIIIVDLDTIKPKLKIQIKPKLKIQTKFWHVNLNVSANIIQIYLIKAYFRTAP